MPPTFPRPFTGHTVPPPSSLPDLPDAADEPTVEVGALVEHCFTDPRGEAHQLRGIVVEVDEHGAYVAQLQHAAYVPFDQLQVL